MPEQERTRPEKLKAKRRRGAALFWLIIIIGAIGGLIASVKIAEESAKRQHEHRRREQARLNGIAAALNDYALRRADIETMPWALQTQGAAIAPRLLSLPCPDNLGDASGTDGLEDAPCGAAANAAVLADGARFGLLPWNQKGPDDANDPRIVLGLGHPFEDGADSDFWYAVARNVAPAAAANARPLNLHHLANAPNSGWLQVAKLSPVNDSADNEEILTKIAAVVIAPGGAKTARIPEATDLSAETDAERQARARGFLDNINTQLPGGAAAVYDNDNADNRFVDAPPRSGFDDRIRHVSAEEWWQEGGEFVRRYQSKIGITEIHNRPAPGSPLEKIREMVAAYHNLLRFYPTPAKNTPANINSTARRGAAFHSGGANITVSTTAAGAITTFAVLSATFASGATASFEVLAAHPITAMLSNAANLVINDENTARNTSPVTIARYARLVIETIIPPNASLSIAAGNVVLLPGAITMTLRRQTPLVPIPPSAIYSGWLAKRPPSANPPVADFRIPIDAVGVFLSPTRLTPQGGRAIVLSGDDTIIVPANMPLAPATLMANITARTEDSGIRILTNPAADAISQQKGQFAIFLLADALAAGGNNAVISAPAVVFPWQRQNAQTNYPPELDANNYYEATFDQTQEMVLPQKIWADPAAQSRREVDTEVPAGLEQFAGEFLSVTVRHAGYEGDTDRPVLVDNTYRANIGFSAAYESKKRAVDAFIGDHPMHYAVSGDCLYGGYACIGRINIAVENGAAVALGQPFTLNAGRADNFVYANNATKTRHRVMINNGIVALPAGVGNVTIGADKIAETLFQQERVRRVFVNGVLQDAVETGTTSVDAEDARPSRLFIGNGAKMIEARLREGQVLRDGMPLILQTGTPVIARSGGIEINNVAALIAFSPAPLTRIACGNAATLLPNKTGGGATVTDQTKVPDARMTDPCAWLDDAENNDGDGNYVVKAAGGGANLSRSNDFFMFFGGRPNL